MDQFNVIRHKFQVEGLSIRKIAQQLTLSRNTVAKYCGGKVTPAQTRVTRRASTKFELTLTKIQEYIANSKGGFTAKQRVTVPTLQKHLENIGFTASRTTVQSAWSEYQRRQQEVFIPLIHRPGDEAQVDFFEVVVCVNGCDRKAWMLLIRLVYSGLDYVNLYDHCDQVSLMDGHVKAFEAFGGVPVRAVYDNLTPVVDKILRTGRKLNERFKNFAAHYCLECDFARPGEGHDKGAVESRGKGIRLQYATPIPKGKSLDEISQQLRTQISSKRTLAEEDILKGCQEIDALRPLPGNHFEINKVVPISISSKSTFQHDNVVYSVPETWARLSATLHVGPFHVEVVCQQGKFRHERQQPGEKKILYRHYVRELSQKPAAVRQVAPELLKELGQPYEKLWGLLEKAHGAQSAARVLAKLIAVIAQGNEAELTESLMEALDQGKTVESAVSPKTKTMSEIPEELAKHRVEPSSVAEFDLLLKRAS
jgi:transposase